MTSSSSSFFFFFFFFKQFVLIVQFLHAGSTRICFLFLSPTGDLQCQLIVGKRLEC